MRRVSWRKTGSGYVIVTSFQNGLWGYSEFVRSFCLWLNVFGLIAWLCEPFVAAVNQTRCRPIAVDVMVPLIGSSHLTVVGRRMPLSTELLRYMTNDCHIVRLSNCIIAYCRIRSLFHLSKWHNTLRPMQPAALHAEYDCIVVVWWIKHVTSHQRCIPGWTQLSTNVCQFC